ncbi:MAG: KamA family radical SAM protein [Proteobacteria bacterium]|nr:KamA family radical SAM protein [Pseudomonadota bacterium]
MRKHGQKIEEPISCHNNRLYRDEEGTPSTLPFIDNVEELSKFIYLAKRTKKAIEQVCKFYPFTIPRFYLNLIEKDNPSCPIRRQAIPSPHEIMESGEIDPLHEKEISFTPSFIKRYPGRGVFLVSSQCAMYCRFCNRRRFVGKGWEPKLFWEETLEYLEKDDEIKEVILSGGDPLMLLPEELDYILSRLRAIRRIKTIRISTRIPVVYPEGLTREHLKAIKRSTPLWFVIHINHPKEVSPEFVKTIRSLRKMGSIIISQTVLLRNVNDCPHILLNLFERLVHLGIKPYYLFQLDEVRGAMHFKVRLKKGIEIMKILRRNASGLAIPQYVVDITGGLGKVPVDYPYIKGKEGDLVRIESPSGLTGTYQDNGKRSKCLKCGFCKSVISG